MAVSPKETLDQLSIDKDKIIEDMSGQATEKDSPVTNGEKPVKVYFEDVSAAAFRIRSGVRNTPCVKSERLSDLLGMEVFCKEDYMQVTGSFKERGARNSLLLLSDEQKKIGVVTASAGNHALALAYHGQLLGIPVTVCMPVNAPITKVSRCEKYGAKIHMVGKDIMEAREYGLQLSRDEKLQYINGYDDPNILAGQGTIALEIIEQIPNIDAVVIPIGGGGLIAGSAVALKTLNPSIQIIGVESEKCASWKAAADAGFPVKITADSSLTLADGLCVSKVGGNSFETAHSLVDQTLTVEEHHIAQAVLRLIEEDKCVVEGAGAVGIAAALSGKLDHLKGKRVVFPLCGGNIDLTVLGRIIERGMAADGRLVKFVVVVSDRPGGLAALTKMLAEAGASVKDIQHERAWLKGSVFTVSVSCMCEVRDYQHGCHIRKLLEDTYETVTWSGNAVEFLPSH